MKLTEFRKMFRRLPPDTEVMLVADWQNINQAGNPELHSANAIETACDEPQGLDDDGRYMVYIYHDPDKIVKR